MSEKYEKSQKAHGQEKDWFRLLQDLKNELKTRIFKLEERVRELEAESRPIK